MDTSRSTMGHNFERITIIRFHSITRQQQKVFFFLYQYSRSSPRNMPSISQHLLTETLDAGLRPREYICFRLETTAKPYIRP